MSSFVILGRSGDATLTLVDLDNGTAEKIPAEAVDKSITKAREAGAMVIKGVDVAIAVDDRAAAVGRFFFDGGSVR